MRSARLRLLGPGAALLLALTLGACALGPLAPTPDFVRVLQHSAPAVVGIGDDSIVLGSGFRIAHTRLIATAAHTLASLQSAPTVHWESKRWPARVVRVDADKDLALLEIDASASMPGLALAPEAATPGQWILVLGCPFGTQPTATIGIVSALPGAVLVPEALARRMQLNAAVNPGNSGGPVLNLNGQVIGVANATIPAGYGLGFAVPVADLAELLMQPGPAPR